MPIEIKFLLCNYCFWLHKHKVKQNFMISPFHATPLSCVTYAGKWMTGMETLQLTVTESTWQNMSPSPLAGTVPKSVHVCQFCEGEKREKKKHSSMVDKIVGNTIFIIIITCNNSSSSNSANVCWAYTMWWALWWMFHMGYIYTMLWGRCSHDPSLLRKLRLREVK